MERPLISLILLHWNRTFALSEALGNFRSMYPENSDIELVIVDDGSIHQHAHETLSPGGRVNGIDGPMRLVYLPPHRLPRNSAAAINAGLDAATGDVLVLQNAETTHRAPLLLRQLYLDCMLKEADYYVLCACRDESLNMWYEHSEHRKKGMHWCAAAHRAVWERAGRLPDWLMEGHCYEDNQLRNQMLQAGATLRWRDDLIVDHHKEWQDKWGDGGSGDRWDPRLVSVNQKRYTAEWGTTMLPRLRQYGITGE